MLALLLVAAGFSTQAQLNYSESFSVDEGGWNHFFQTTEAPCTSAGSLAGYFYNGLPTDSTESPSLGTATGLVVNLSYDYKLISVSNFNTTYATPANFGSFEVQWASAASGPWTTLETVGAANHIPSLNCATRTVSFTPPAGAVYVRFKVAWNAGDYLLYIDEVNAVEVPACTGTPAAGTVVAPLTSTCTNTPFTLNVTGSTAASGFTYQWESTPAGGTVFTAIAGATNATYTVANQTAATDYRRVTTCTGLGAAATSAAVSVGQNTLSDCYCTPFYSNQGLYDNITNVVLGTLNDSLPPNASPYYFNRISVQNAVPTISTGSVISLSISMGNDYDQYDGVWIDWNQDGFFATTEFYSSYSNAGPNGTATLSILVPFNALTGNTRMRIRGGDDSPILDMEACGATSSSRGQALDYAVNVALGTPCTGTATGGTVAPALSNVCPGSTVTLTATGFTAGAGGLNFQWESAATATGTFTAISGANNPYYTPPAYTSGSRFYRLTVTCTNSSLSGSSNVAEISGPVAPATQATAIAVIPQTGADVTVKWSPGTGNNRVVYISNTAAFTPPVSPNAPGSANSTYSGSGQQLVYDGGDTSVELTGLTTGTTYYAIVYETVVCSPTSYYYTTTSGTGNTATFIPASPPANDACSGAIAVQVANGFVTFPVLGTMAGATASNPTVTGALGCTFFNYIDSNQKDVWYTVTVPTAGSKLVVQLHPTGGIYDSENDYNLQAFTGSCAAGLTYLNCDQDGSNDATPADYMPALEISGQAANTVIYLRVRKSSGSRTAFNISVRDTAAAVLPAVTAGGACLAANTVTISPASNNAYQWVPVLDGSGNIAAEIYANGNNLGTVTTSVNVNTTGTIRTSGGSVYADRNFTITPTTQPTADVFVRLYLKAAEVAALEAAVPSLNGAYDITILKNDNPCGNYVSTPATTTSGSLPEAYGLDTAFAITVSSFSSFYLSGGTAPLPVNLTAISARAIGKANRVDWTSASEEAAAAFVVERSTNGVEFAAIGKVAAQGKSAAYTFTDEAPAAGISYYRLQMLDVNGESNYSRTVTATQGRSNTVAMSAYPNPATDRLTVEVAGATEGSTITLKDLSGKTLAQQTLVGNSAVFSVASLPAGLYFAVYTGGNATQVIKITKQ